MFRFAVLSAPCLRPLALLCACASGPALALGFGQVHGVQQVGRPFYAEIPLHSAENLHPSCLAVGPVPGEESYFPGEMRIAIEGRALARRLVLTTRLPIREPLVVFQVRAGCETELARDYSLLAAAPQRPELARTGAAVANSLPVAAPHPGPASTADDVLSIQRPTTLNALARALYPDDREARDGFRAAYAAANPELFAGIEHVGAVALARGTQLKRPADLWLAAPREARRRTETAATPNPSLVMPPSKAARSDHLSLGSAAGQIKLLADAITRLEQGHGERERLQGEMVGAVAGAVNGIVELRDHLQQQDQELKRFRGLLEEERQARERSAAPGLLALLGLVFVGGALGAGLTLLQHRLAARRASPPALPGTIGADAAGPFAAVARRTVADAAAQAPQPTAAVEQEASLPVMPPAVIVKASAPPPECDPPTAVAAGAPPAEAAVAVPKQELGLDALMDTFQQHSAEVAACVNHLRDTGSRDLAEWLDLVRLARQAGLLNESSIVDMAREFRRMFNVDLDGSTEASIESFPRVRKALIANWGKRAILAYIDGLIYDDRDGTRTGFPEAVAVELVLLRDVARCRAQLHGFDDDPHPFDGADQALDLDARVDDQAPPKLAAEGIALPSLRRSQAASAEREFAIDFDLGEIKKPDGA